MFGFEMGTLNFLVYMALLTDGGRTISKVVYKHRPPGGGQAHHFRRHKKVGWLGAAAHLV